MGSGWRHSQKTNEDQRDRPRRWRSGDHGVAEPVLLLALVEHELQAADADRDQAEAHEVDLGSLALLLRFQIRRVFDHAVAQVERQQADGQVDEEDPVPVEVVGDPAAERGADGRRDDDGHAVDGEGLAALFDGEGVGEDGLLAGREAAAAEALQDAGEDRGAAASARGRRAASRR